MSAPIFYAADMSAAVFTASLAENALYPLSNLYTMLPSDLWKSSASTNGQTFKIDLGSAKPCDFVGFGTHNFYNMPPPIQLQYDTADNPAFTSPVDVAIVNGISSAPSVSTFTLATKRYWRIYFANTAGIIPQIGLFFLGSRLVLPHTQDWDFNIGDKEYQTNGRRSISGILRTVSIYGGVGKHTFKISLTDDAFRLDWQALCAKTRGAFRPFLWADHLDVIRISHFVKDYAPITGHRYNITDLEQIELIDQSPS